MVRFLRVLEPSITEKLDIQLYWSFEDVSKLAIKLEIYSKGKRIFGSLYTKPTAPPKPFIPSKPKVTPKEAGREDNGKAFVKEFPSSLMARGVLNVKAMDISKLIARIGGLTLKEIKEIDHFALELTEEDEEEEEANVVLTSDVGELLVLQRILHTKESAKEDSQREHIFNSRCTIQVKVCSLIIDWGNWTNVASTQLVSKLNLPTVPPHTHSNGLRKEMRYNLASKS